MIFLVFVKKFLNRGYPERIFEKKSSVIPEKNVEKIAEGAPKNADEIKKKQQGITVRIVKEFLYELLGPTKMLEKFLQNKLQEYPNKFLETFLLEVPYSRIP